MFSTATWGSDYFPFGYGGYVGRLLYHKLLADALGPFGSGLILGTIYCGALLFILVAFHCATAFSAEPKPDNVFLHAATLAAFGLIITLTGGGAWALEERIGGGGKSAGGDKPAIGKPVFA